MNKYQIKEGPAKGLINKVDVDNAIIDEVTERIRPSIKNANDLAEVSYQRDVVSQVIKEMSGKVFKGTCNTKKQTREWTDAEGVVHTETYTVQEPNVTSPTSCGLGYTKEILNQVERELVRTFTPYTPKLEHKPDKKKFAILASQLFPNVDDPWEAIEALRQFFENIHHSCKTPGAVFKQKCLWLVSERTGFTGKSHFLVNLQEVLDEIEVDSHIGGFDKDWFDPINALHTVLMVNDLDTLPSVHVLNGLIDRTKFHYNKKGGASGDVTSCTNLLVTSNLEPWKQNRRRFNTIHFPGISVDYLTAEEKAFFPFWGKDDEYRKCIKDLLIACPFNSPYINPNANLKAERSDQYADILMFIRKGAKWMVEQHIEANVMPNAFLETLAEKGFLVRSEFNSIKPQLRDFLSQQWNEGKLKERGTKTDPWKRPIDFAQFLEWECGFEDTPEGVNWLEDIHNKWQDLIKQQEGK